jgi:hypothetical protein
MNNFEEITISKREYDALLKNQMWLSALEAAGVANWSGWDYAKDILSEMMEDE